MKKIIPVLTFVLLSAVCLAESEVALSNPNFEEEVKRDVWAWPYGNEDVARAYRTEEAAHSGMWSFVIENDESKFTTVRGAMFPVKEGDIVEFTGWIRAGLEGASNGAMLRVLFLDGEGNRVGNVRSPAVEGDSDWTFRRLLAPAPAGATAFRPFFDIYRGEGRAYFDTLDLKVHTGRVDSAGDLAVAVFTDLEEGAPTFDSVKTLLGEHLILGNAEEPTGALQKSSGALVLFEGSSVSGDLAGALTEFAARGNPVFMDIRNFGEWAGVSVEKVEAEGGHVVEKCLEATAGFRTGDQFPRRDRDGNLYVVADGEAADAKGIVALARTDGGVSFAAKPVGNGRVYGLDMFSVAEPNVRNYWNAESAIKTDGSFYKYLFMTNVLTNPVRYGEWYPEKVSYAEIIEMMKKIADTYPEITLEEEGVASGDGYVLYSLNAGAADAPLYFFYGAAHGHEWEPAYGLLTFARRLAEGDYADVIDLGEVAFKIIPVLNPWGYDNYRRQNANHVDLNRQGDQSWEESGQDIEGYDETHSRWKGYHGPFSEPETIVYKRIIDENADRLFFVLDFHGNPNATWNPLTILREGTRPENFLKSMHWVENLNSRIDGRYLLQQTTEETPSKYLMRRPYVDQTGRPMLTATSTRDRYGFVIEITATLPTSIASIMVTDLVGEIIRSIFEVYPEALTAGIEANAADQVRLRIRSSYPNQSIPVAATLWINDQEVGSQRSVVDAEEKVLAFKLADALDGRNRFRAVIESDSEGDGGKRLERPVEIVEEIDFGDLVEVARVSPERGSSDGRFSWNGTSALSLDSEEDVHPVAARNRWRGPEDLSGEVRLGWDGKDYIFIRVSVRDPQHHNDQEGDEIWDGDSLQLAFAPRRSVATNDDFFVIGFALTSDGVRSHQWYGPETALLDEAGYEVVRDEAAGRTIYEVRLPLERLTIEPGAVFNFNAVVFQGGEEGRHQYWMQLSPGLAGGRNPAAYRGFILR